MTASFIPVAVFGGLCYTGGMRHQDETNDALAEMVDIVSQNRGLAKHATIVVLGQIAHNTAAMADALETIARAVENFAYPLHRVPE